MSTLRDELIETLERENDDLRARIRELETLVGMRFQSPPQFGFTRHESVIFGLLMKAKLVSKPAAITALYLHEQDEAEEKIVDVFVCRMRKKLKPYNIEIQTQWGQGFFLSVESKATAQRLLDEVVA